MLWFEIKCMILSNFAFDNDYYFIIAFRYYSNLARIAVINIFLVLPPHLYSNLSKTITLISSPRSQPDVFSPARLEVIDWAGRNHFEPPHCCRGPFEDSKLCWRMTWWRALWVRRESMISYLLRFDIVWFSSSFSTWSWLLVLAVCLSTTWRILVLRALTRLHFYHLSQLLLSVLPLFPLLFLLGF